MKQALVLVFAALLVLPALAEPELIPREVRTPEGRFRVVTDTASSLPVELKPVTPRKYAGDPETAARQFLADQAQLLQVDPGLGGFSAEAVRQSPGGLHVKFRQQHDGLAVVNAYIAVHQDWEGRIVLAQQNGAKPEADWPSSFPEYATSLALARADFQSHSGYVTRNKYQPEKPRLIEDELRLARKVYFLEAGEPVAAWEIVLAGTDTVAEVTYWVGGTPQRILGFRSAVLDFNGSGRAFLPNPVNSLNDSSLRDSDPDSDFTSAYANVTLPGLAGTGPYTLTGPWITIVSMTSESPLINPPSETSGTFNYTRSQDGFEAVNAYYWIDWSQRYMQALGFNAIDHRSINVDVHGLSGADNSHYVGSPIGAGYIAYGDGGVDDAEDADIILHEYGHSIQDSSNPGAYFGSGQTGAMGEGFGDYWAFSQTYQLSVQHGFDPFCIGEWDSTSYSPPCLRRVDTEKIYPNDYVAGDIYASSGIWSSALKNLFLQLGATVCDSIVLESHFLVPDYPTFYQGAMAILQADGMLYGGAHNFEICQEFYKRGIFTMQDWRDNAALLELSVLDLVELEGNGNGMPEPGELIGIDLAVQNTGSMATGPVAALLAGPSTLLFYQPSSGLPPLPADSPIVDASQPFTFWIDSAAACGSEIPLDLSLDFDGHQETWSLTMLLGDYAESTLQSDDLEAASALWQTSAAVGSTVHWARQTYAQYHNGSTVWFAPDLNQVNDEYLVWGPLNLPAGYYYLLSFWHTYSFESGFDGAVLELSTDGSTWTDLGPDMLQNGYDRAISTSYNSPIKGRSAWTGGTIGAMKQVLVDLSAWAGQNVSVRYRCASDSSVGSTGWAVDDVSLIQQALDCEVVDIKAGDLDDNGVRNAVDVMLLKNLLADKIAAGEGAFVRPESAADVNRDGAVNAADLMALLRLLGQ